MKESYASDTNEIDSPSQFLTPQGELNGYDMNERREGGRQDCYVCKFCGRTYSMKVYFDLHVKKHEGEFDWAYFSSFLFLPRLRVRTPVQTLYSNGGDGAEMSEQFLFFWYLMWKIIRDNNLSTSYQPHLVSTAKQLIWFVKVYLFL